MYDYSSIKQGSNGKIGYPVDCSSNPFALWLFMEYAKRSLLDPVEWTILQETAPEEIRRLQPTKEEVLTAALEYFYSYVWELNAYAMTWWRLQTMPAETIPEFISA